MERARGRIALARTAVDAGLFDGAVSAAYYGMLYAARAALSEEDKSARTHRGTWALFRTSFVEPGRFDSALFERAQGSQPLREGADYEAFAVPREHAEALVAQAERFVSAVEALLA